MSDQRSPLPPGDINGLELALRRARSGDIARVLRYLHKGDAVIAALQEAEQEARATRATRPPWIGPHREPPTNPPTGIPVTTKPRRRFLRGVHQESTDE